MNPHPLPSHTWLDKYLTECERVLAILLGGRIVNCARSRGSHFGVADGVDVGREKAHVGGGDSDTDLTIALRHSSEVPSSGFVFGSMYEFDRVSRRAKVSLCLHTTKFSLS
jgi:hypothetical protein